MMRVMTDTHPNSWPDAPDFEALSNTYLKELQMAKHVQQALLAVENPACDGLTVVARCVPADNIGGDFYTFVRQERETFSPSLDMPGVLKYGRGKEPSLGIAVGDVAGHGISSALVMALTSGLLREMSLNYNSPAAVLRYSNNAIVRHLRHSHIAYVTAAFAIIYPAQKRLVLARGGHPPVLLIRQNGAVEELLPEGVFLGMFENEVYEEMEIELRPGDRLVFYTDGITETKGPDHSNSGDPEESGSADFGLARFKELLTLHRSASAQQLSQIVFDTLLSFSGTNILRDDQTLVVVDVD